MAFWVRFTSTKTSFPNMESLGTQYFLHAGIKKKLHCTFDVMSKGDYSIFYNF